MHCGGVAGRRGCVCGEEQMFEVHMSQQRTPTVIIISKERKALNGE